MPAKSVQHRLTFPRRPGRPRLDPFDRRGHHKRPELDTRVPLMITQKLRADVPNARTFVHLAAFEELLLHKQDPERLRVIEYTLQRDHYHLIVEVPGGREGLAGAMRGFHGALTKAWNALWQRRGGLFASYDECPLTNPRKASNMVRYVLWNGWHHDVSGIGADKASSAPWTEAWSRPHPFPVPAIGLCPTYSASTTILREAYRRFPLDPTLPPHTLVRRR